MKKCLNAAGFLQGFLLLLLTFSVVAFFAIEDAHAQTGAAEIFATCVGDGNCAAGPVGALCPNGLPGQDCESCEFQYARGKCVFSWTEVCLLFEWDETTAGCGKQWVGDCLGGRNSECLNPQLTGVNCSTSICVGVPVL